MIIVVQNVSTWRNYLDSILSQYYNIWAYIDNDLTYLWKTCMSLLLIYGIDEWQTTLSFLTSRYLKIFFSSSILSRTVWYPKYCQHHTLNVYYSYHKCANEIWHNLFAQLNILRLIIFGYKTNFKLINYDIIYFL